MKYSEARTQIKSGDMLAWSHRVNPFNSWRDFKIFFVRLAGVTEITHVGCAWVIGGRVLVFEAVKPYVRIHPLSTLGEFEWLQMNVAWNPDAEEYALAHVGEEYSELQAAMSPFGEPPDDKYWQCAEYLARILRRCGIDLGNVFTPAALVLKARLLGAVQRTVTPD